MKLMQTPQALIDGPSRDALRESLRSLESVEARGASPLARLHALTEVARCYLALGSFDAADAHLRQALRWAHCLGSADAAVELLCDLAELASLQAAQAQGPHARKLRDRAHERVLEAASLASRAADPHWEVHVLLRVSDVLARCGDHGDALAMQCRALNLLVREGTPTLDSDRRGDAQLM